MTEKENMVAGKIYDPTDGELRSLRKTAHRLCMEYNAITDDRSEEREKILRELVPEHGENLYLQGPIQFDYGRFTKFGKNCYANFNLVVLDSCPVTIGDDVFFGPNCSVVTAMHPLVADERRQRRKPDGSFYTKEYAKPITIKDCVWFGSNVTVCGGVTIGENCVIGAGSVVTRDIPPNSLAAGSPCRVIRKITDGDRMLDA